MIGGLSTIKIMRKCFLIYFFVNLNDIFTLKSLEYRDLIFIQKDISFS